MSFVYRNRFGAMKYAGGAWLLMIVCLSVFFWPHAAVEPSVSHIRRLAFAYVGAPICFILFLSFLRDVIQNKPVLAVDESGVTIRDEPIIPWVEIESVRTFKRNGKELIGVYVRDIELLARRYPGKAGDRFKMVHEQTGAAAIVAQESLVEPIATVMGEISELCRSKISEM